MSICFICGLPCPRQSRNRQSRVAKETLINLILSQPVILSLFSSTGCLDQSGVRIGLIMPLWMGGILVRLDDSTRRWSDQSVTGPRVVLSCMASQCSNGLLSGWYPFATTNCLCSHGVVNLLCRKVYYISQIWNPFRRSSSANQNGRVCVYIVFASQHLTTEKTGWLTQNKPTKVFENNQT